MFPQHGRHPKPFRTLEDVELFRFAEFSSLTGHQGIFPHQDTLKAGLPPFCLKKKARAIAQAKF